MVKFFLLGLVLFFNLSCSVYLSHITSKEDNLSTTINELIDKLDSELSIGLKVISLENNEELFELNSEKLLLPASNQKLLTSAASLYYLGENKVFQTSVLKKNRNIILLAGADSELSIDKLDSISLKISQKIKNIDTIFVDAGIMDSIPYGKGWMWDEGSETYSAPVSGIILNGNCIDFEYSPNELDKPARLNTYPNTNHISITNNSITVEDTLDYKRIKIERDWQNQTNHYRVDGEILGWSNKDTVKKNISDPVMFAGTVFKELFESHNVSVSAVKARKGIHSLDTIAKIISQPLKIQLKNIMQNSENLASEVLMKYIGISDTTIGSWYNGKKKIMRFLYEEVEIDTNFLRIADGSGLSRYNLLNADQLIKLLRYMYTSNLKDTFIMSLPHGGQKGTKLENRLIESGKRIYAKTGSLSGVSCLSGYAFSPQYGPLAFSIIINGFTGSIKPIREIQDKICESLVHRKK